MVKNEKQGKELGNVVSLSQLNKQTHLELFILLQVYILHQIITPEQMLSSYYVPGTILGALIIISYCIIETSSY